MARQNAYSCRPGGRARGAVSEPGCDGHSRWLRGGRGGGEARRARRVAQASETPRRSYKPASGRSGTSGDSIVLLPGDKRNEFGSAGVRAGLSPAEREVRIGGDGGTARAMSNNGERKRGEGGERIFISETLWRRIILRKISFFFFFSVAPIRHRPNT